MPTIFDKFDLTGRTAIVTGAGTGIGAAIASTLASAGAHVVVSDVSAKSAKTSSQAIVDSGFSSEPAQLDVRVRTAVDGLVDRIVEERGRLDVYVNNAGIISDGTPMSLTEDEIDRVHAVNFKGLVFGSQAAARAMIARGTGSIVNITTAGIDGPSTSVPSYTTAKAAAHQFTRSLALEIGPKGVRVNAVAPGHIETPMTTRHISGADGALDEDALTLFRSQRAEVSPLGLVGDPADIGYAVLYLVSDAARFVTGAVMRPNGGMTMLW